MLDPAIAKTGPTLPAVFAFTGEQDVATKSQQPSLGQRIARLRLDKSMTQVELAGRLGVSQPVVSDYENDVLRLPADVVARVSTGINQALQDAEVKARLARLGIEPVGGTPQQFAAMAQADRAKWKTIIDERKLTAD